MLWLGSLVLNKAPVSASKMLGSMTISQPYLDSTVVGEKVNSQSLWRHLRRNVTPPAV